MSSDNIYVYWGGISRLGRRFLNYCVKKKNIFPPPDYYVDSNTKLVGTHTDGVRIISPSEMLELAHREASLGRRLKLVITTRGYSPLEMIATLKKWEFEAIGDIILGESIYAKTYLDENSHRINAIEANLQDENSRLVYRSIFNNLIKGQIIDFSLVSSPSYFANDVIMTIANNEIIVDAGVCDGEEIDRLLIDYPNTQVLAFEPDKSSLIKLTAKYKNKPNIRLIDKALWHKEEYLSFNNSVDSSTSAITSDESKDKILAAPLDSLLKEDTLKDIKPTFIKMDIEGAEYNALLGASDFIKKHRPKLAICLYHSLEDYVIIPELILSWNLDYRYYVRQHSVTNTETVFYALPN